MPNQFPPFFISRKTALIGILNMMFIVGQCVPFNPGPFFNNDFDYKASSITSGDSQYNYPIKRLSTEKYKSPADDDKYSSIRQREISGLNTYSSFKSESPEPESLFLRIRKRDDDEESSPKPESDENEEEPKAESGENEEEPKAESGENEEEPKAVSGENEEEPKAESGENEEEPKAESGENEESPAQARNEENPDEGGESSPPESVEKEESSHERQTEESVSLSTSNLEEPPVLPTSDQGDMPFFKNKDASEEGFVFQKKPLSFDVLKQKGKVEVSTTADGLDSGPNEFMPEDNWDEDSFYPRSFPNVWKGKKSRTIKPPQPMVSWNEFLVMQDKFQKEKLNLNTRPLKNNKLNSPFHKSKDNLYSFVEDAIKRNKQIEKELMDLKRMLQKGTSEQKSSSQFSGFPRIINNTLQLNVPLLQKGKIMPQEFKIKIEAEAPLKIKTHVGDGKADAISINDKPLRLGERSSEDLNTTSTNKIQVREIPTSTKMPDMLTVSTEPVRDPSSTLTASTTGIIAEAEDDDPLKAERTAFIRKGAEFLRRAWYKYKQKRYSFRQ